MLTLLSRIMSTAALALLLTACGSQIAQPSSLSNAADAEAQIAEKSAEKSAAEIPERPFDEATMARVLQAELALYRQDLLTALSLYEVLSSETRDPGIAKRTAELALTSSDPERALNASLDFLDIAPDDPYAYELAARALTRNGEIEGAWQLVIDSKDNGRVLRMVSSDAANVAAQFKNTEQVDWLLKQILTEYGPEPESAERLLSIAILNGILGNADSANRYAELAGDADPDNFTAIRLRVNSLRQEDKNKEAAKLLANWIAKNKDNAEDSIAAAQILAAIDQESALPVYKDLSEEYPWIGRLLLGTAQLALGAMKYEEAIPYLEKLARIGEFRELALFNLGRVHEQIEENATAIGYYEQVGDPDRVLEARVRAARLALQGASSERVEAKFRALRAELPSQEIALFHEQGQLLADLGDPQGAVTAFSRGLELDPANESLLYARAITFERAGQIDLAITDMRRIVAKDDTNASALNALGYTLANRTEYYDEAYTLIKRALSISPEDPAIIDSMGWVLFKLGKTEEALAYLRVAHEKLLDEEVISHLVEVLWTLGEYEEAQETMRQGREALPESELLQETSTRLNIQS